MSLYNGGLDFVALREGGRFFIRGHEDEDLADSVGEKTSNVAARTYVDVMCKEALKREKEETLRLIMKKHQKGKEVQVESIVWLGEIKNSRGV
ncbi:hypothetical protein SUGI_1031370 [Cryptomeria japonica]|nr:hypothetical protein SUGI_1031370 [Cryptomeria japonica]